MRHDLAIAVASALLVIGSQTRAAADSGSLSQGSQDSTKPSRVQADVGALGAVPVDSQVFTAGMSSDPALVAKGHDDNKDKDKDKNKDGEHRRDGDHRRDGNHDKDKDKDKDHDWGRGGDTDTGDSGRDTPPSPTPEPGTLLLAGLVAASAGLRARRARKSR